MENLDTATSTSLTTIMTYQVTSSVMFGYYSKKNHNSFRDNFWNKRAMMTKDGSPGFD